MAKADEEFARMMERLTEVREADSRTFDKEREQLMKDIDGALKKTVKTSELTAKAATGFKNSVTSLLPSPKEMLDSVTTNNPGLNLLAKTVGSITSGIKTAREVKAQKRDRINDLESMMAELMDMQKPEMPEMPGVEVPGVEVPEIEVPQTSVTVEGGQIEVPDTYVTLNATMDKVLTSNDRQLEVLMDLYEAWEGTRHVLQDQLEVERYSLALAEDEARRADHADVTDAPLAIPPSSPTPEGWQPEESKKKGFLNSLMEVAGEMLFYGGATISKFGPKLVSGAKMLSKGMGGVAAVFGVVYDFLEGFISPEEILGRESEGIRDRMIAGYTSVAAGMGSIVDWIAGFAGLELNSEDYIKEKGKQIADGVRDLIDWLPGAVAKVSEAAVDAIGGMLDTIVREKDEAFEMLGGTKAFLSGLMNDLMDSVQGWIIGLLEGLKSNLPGFTHGFIDSAIDMATAPEPQPQPKYTPEQVEEINRKAEQQKAERERKFWEEMYKNSQANNNAQPIPDMASNSTIVTDARTTQTNNVTNFTGTKPGAYNDDPTLQRINRFGVV